MALLLLKLTLTPLVVISATLVARRFGPAVSGWLIGLPLTSAPVALFLTIQHGSRFTAHVAQGFVAGLSCVVASAIAYVLVARRNGSWGLSALAGAMGFVVMSVALDRSHASSGALLAVLAGVLLIARRVVPTGRAVTLSIGRWELPVRVVVVTGLVLAITEFAGRLGPGVSGIATTYPLLPSMLALSVHRADGAAAAIAIYRGLITGILGAAAFGITLMLVLSRVQPAVCFVFAISAALCVQAGSLKIIRREEVAAA